MYPKTLAAILTLSAPIAYLMHLHRDLARKLQHSSTTGTLTASMSTRVNSIPPSLLGGNYRMVCDSVSKPVPTALLPGIDQHELLTRYLRRNMTAFSRLPQAWLLHLMSPRADRESFRAAYIRALDFDEGDVVCGYYTVASRTKERVELALKSVGPVGGRLIITVEQRADDTVFSTETMMWQSREEKGFMPLEKTVVKWVHELTSWWLLDSGTAYLIALKKEVTTSSR